MLRILTCVDLDSLFALLCGERLESGKVKLAVGEGMAETTFKSCLSMFVPWNTSKLWLLIL